jgi:hypothetical protein
MPDEPDKPDPELITGSLTASVGAAQFKFIGGEAKLTVHSPLPPDHPINTMVGHVASTWSHVEHVLDLIIWELSKTEPTLAACITAQIMGIPPRCKAIIALGKVRGLAEATLKCVERFMRKSYDVADERNRIIHDPWYISKGETEPAQFKSMPFKDWRYGIKPVTESAIKQTIETLTQRLTEAHDLRKKILDELQSLQGKQP